MHRREINRNLLLHLLTENELNHRQIAERLRCSPERVRQLELELLGRTGHEAHRERRERKLRKIFESKPFVMAAREKGLDIEPAIASDGGWHDKQLYVNGQLCLLRRADEGVGYRGLYVSIRKPRNQRLAEICIVELSDGNFLFIPMKQMPKYPTMFRASLDGVYKLKPSCRKYLNDWSGFGKSSRQRLRKHIF